MTSCPTSELLTLYHYEREALAAGERRHIAEHLLNCPACQAALQEVKATAGLLQSRVDDTPVPDLTGRVLAQLARSTPVPTRRRITFRLLLPAAAALLLLIGGTLWYGLPTPTPARHHAIIAAQTTSGPLTDEDVELIFASGEDEQLLCMLDELGDDINYDPVQDLELDNGFEL